MATVVILLAGDGPSGIVTGAVVAAIAVVAALAALLVRRARTRRDGAASVASDAKTFEPVIDLDALDALDQARSGRFEVVLRPDPLWQRRLAERPDALIVAADDIGLDVPGWMVEGRSRMIEPTDRVMIRWAAIERFRVRADRHGPDVYDITARADAGPPPRWRVRRDEISDEVRLLDGVRTVGRITIDLEDSIRTA